MRTFATALALLVTSAAPALAQGPQRCSRETFVVSGAPIAVSACAAAPEGQRVAVTESFSRGAQSFSRTATVDVLPGADVSRGFDDASLAPLGLASTLHLTLAYRAGNVTIEHALLVPGAIPLK